MEKTAQAPVSCAKCGACAPVCPLYQLTGRESFTARGKLHLLQKIPLSEAAPQFAEILSRCLLCGACSSICPRGLDIPSMVSRARAELPPSLVATPLSAEVMQAGMQSRTVARLLGGATRMLEKSILQLLPDDSGLRLRLSLPQESFPEKRAAGRRPVPRKVSLAEPANADTVHIFEGCYARYLQNEITDATKTLLADRLSLSSVNPGEQQCCGLAFSSTGKRDRAIKLAQKNIEAFASSDDPILVTCASCYSHLTSYPSLFADDPAWQQRAVDFTARLQEFSSFLKDRGLTDQLEKTESRADVYFHDSCHLRFHCRITKPPRQLLRSIAALRLAEPAGGYQCCGAGGLFQLYHPALAGQLQSELAQTVTTLEVSHVLSTCSGCLLHLHKGLASRTQPVKVQHLAVFLAERFF